MGRTKGQKLVRVERKKGKKEDNGVESSQKDEKETKGAEGGQCCVDCGKAVLTSQQGIKCDACDFWHHCACEKVSEEIYNFFCDHEEEVTIQWYCRKCAATCGKMRAIMVSMHEQQQRLEERVEEMSRSMGKKIEELAATVGKKTTWEDTGSTTKAKEEDSHYHKRVEEKVDALMSTVKEQQRKERGYVQEAVNLRMKEDRAEEDEIRKRSANIIVHGLQEKEDDREKRDQIEGLLHEIDCDDISVKSNTRLGKKSEDLAANPRPLLITLASQEQREKVLRQAKNLKGKKKDGLDKVFLHQDLTPLQRKKRQLLVAEMKERKNNGEQDLIIVNEMIVTKRTKADQGQGNTTQD